MNNKIQIGKVEWVRTLLFFYGVLFILGLATMVIVLGVINCRVGTSYCNPTIKNSSPFLIVGGVFILKFIWDMSSRKRRSEKFKQYGLFRTLTVSKFDSLVGLGQFMFAATLGFVVMQILRLRLFISDSFGVVIMVMVLVSLLEFLKRYTGIDVLIFITGEGLLFEKVPARFNGKLKQFIIGAFVFGVLFYLLLRMTGLR